ncbi:MAG TPA: hypothetical protein VFB75_10050 [Burkholderiales bacterium]|nr:hypothetical protein [Burkholderiales bacterium]
MFARKNELSRSRTAIIAAVHLFALSAAGAGAYVAFADEAASAVEITSKAHAPVDLEQAFWACDYAGTKYGVHNAPMAFCGEVTAELKQQKFGGDFLQMLEWWQQNKPTQHRRLEADQVAHASVR